MLSALYDCLAFEGIVPSNPVPPIRKRYLSRYKDDDATQERQLISVEDMARLINSEMSIRNKAILTLLAKTGIRCNELIIIDVGDVDLVDYANQAKANRQKDQSHSIL